MTFVYLLLILMGAACAVFIIQNKDPVVISFAIWHLDAIPLSLVILLSVLGGMLFATCVGLIGHWKQRRQIRQLEARLAVAERPPQPPAP